MAQLRPFSLMTAPRRVRLLFAATWLLAVPGSEAAQTSQGHASCRCIDVSARLQGCSLHREGHCFAGDYGSGCGAHDEGLAECSAAKPPAHCDMRWCFVDGAVCQKSEQDMHAMKFPEPSNDRLHYS